MSHVRRPRLEPPSVSRKAGRQAGLCSALSALTHGLRACEAVFNGCGQQGRQRGRAHRQRGLIGDRRGMSDRFNTIAGWTLFAGIVALGTGNRQHEDCSIRSGPNRWAMRSKASRRKPVRAARRPAPRSTLCSPRRMSPQARRSSPSARPATRSRRAGQNGVGPNLYGIVGDSKAEGRAGFAFSDALKKVGGKWALTISTSG